MESINLEKYPTLQQTQGHTKTSNKYGFVPTGAMLEILADYGWKPSKVMESRANKEGNAGYQGHIVRLQQQNSPLIVGDSLPEIVLKNSHMGTSSFQLMAGVYRVVCSNGMVAGENFSTYKVTHRGFAASKAEIAVKEVLKELPAVIEEVNNFKSLTLKDSAREVYSKAVVELINEEGKWALPYNDMLRPRRWEDREDLSLWGAFNVAQENLIKGGIRRQSVETGKRIRTRAVNSPDKNVALNRALWTITSEMAKHLN